jgi:FecR protein
MRLPATVVPICGEATRGRNIPKDGHPKRGPSDPRKLLSASLSVMLMVCAFPGPGPALAAGGVCALVASDRNPSDKILQCGQELTVRPAEGSRWRTMMRPGQRLPTGIRLDSGALLIEYHPETPPQTPQTEFQILTPLAIAAVRGTKWAMEVSATKTSTLVLSGAVAVTSRRLNQYVVLNEGQGVDISVGDTSLTQKSWGQARIRALLSRFGE